MFFMSFIFSFLNHHFLKLAIEWMMPIVVARADGNIEGDFGNIKVRKSIREINGFLLFEVHLCEARAVGESP